MHQADMFGGRSLKEAAIETVTANSGDWMDKALAALELLPDNVRMTGEDVRNRVVEQVGEPHHHNAWGALILHGVRNRTLLSTGKWTHMKKPSSHARRNPIYLTNT